MENQINDNVKDVVIKTLAVALLIGMFFAMGAYFTGKSSGETGTSPYTRVTVTLQDKDGNKVDAPLEQGLESIVTTLSSQHLDIYKACGGVIPTSTEQVVE